MAKVLKAHPPARTKAQQAQAAAVSPSNEVASKAAAQQTTKMAQVPTPGFDKAAFKQALDDIRELSEMAAKSQAEAFDVVRKRISDNVDEVSKLLRVRK